LAALGVGTGAHAIHQNGRALFRAFSQLLEFGVVEHLITDIFKVGIGGGDVAAGVALLILTVAPWFLIVSVGSEQVLPSVRASPLLLGFFLIVQAKLVQFINQFISLIDVDVLKLSFMAHCGHLIIIGELE
jgi:hypothetical protein